MKEARPKKMTYRSFHFYVFLESTNKSVVQKADQWLPGDGFGAAVGSNSEEL